MPPKISCVAACSSASNTWPSRAARLTDGNGDSPCHGWSARRQGKRRDARFLASFNQGIDPSLNLRANFGRLIARFGPKKPSSRSPIRSRVACHVFAPCKPMIAHPSARSTDTSRRHHHSDRAALLPSRLLLITDPYKIPTPAPTLDTGYHATGATRIQQEIDINLRVSANCGSRWMALKQASGGAAGIRTLDELLAHTHFPGERLRPLGHRSALLGRCAP
jgi:hypothetical protein